MGDPQESEEEWSHWQSFLWDHQERQEDLLVRICSDIKFEQRYDIVLTVASRVFMNMPRDSMATTFLGPFTTVSLDHFHPQPCITTRFKEAPM